MYAICVNIYNRHMCTCVSACVRACMSVRIISYFIQLSLDQINKPTTLLHLFIQISMCKNVFDSLHFREEFQNTWPSLSFFSNGKWIQFGLHANKKESISDIFSKEGLGFRLFYTNRKSCGLISVVIHFGFFLLVIFVALYRLSIPFILAKVLIVRASVNMSVCILV